MSLDFTPLSDDQLIELLRAGFQEASQRGVAVAAAVQSAMLSEAEKVEIAHDAARIEAERLRQDEARRIAAEAAEKVRQQAEAQKSQSEAAEQERLWALKNALSVRITDILDLQGVEVNLWIKEGEKRVYINVPNSRDSLVDYYHTGNSRKAPGTLEIARPHNKHRDEIRAFCEQIISGWKSLRHPCNATSDAFKARRKAEAEAATLAKAAETERKRLEAEEAYRAAQAARIERQEKLRALLGGQPILVKRGVRVQPQVEYRSSSHPDGYQQADNGRRTLVVVRPTEGSNAILLCTITVDSTMDRNRPLTNPGKLLAGKRLTDQAVTLDALPSEIAEWFDAEERAALAVAADLPEVPRDEIAIRFATDRTDPDSYFNELRSYWKGAEHTDRRNSAPQPVSA
jgi:hypothetical protein